MELEKFQTRGLEKRVVDESDLQSPDNLGRKFKRFKFRRQVAQHELGHARLASKLGWQVTEFEINGQGNVLGWVRLAPPNKSLKQLLEDSAVIAFGGNVATGQEWGCGGDFGHIESLANIYQAYFGIGRDRFKSEQKGRACSLLSFDDLEEEAENLSLDLLAA